MKKTILALAAFALSAQAAFAGDLSVPFAGDSAGILPKGIRNVRVTTLTTTVADRFNAQGNIEGLAHKMNRPITWNHLARGQASMMDRASLRGYLKSSGFDLNQTVGTTHGVVNSRVTVSVPVVAYGLNEKTTLAVAVPIIYSNVNVDTGWTAQPVVHQALKTLSADGKHDKVLQYGPKLQNVVETEFAQKGYKAPKGKEKSQVGDVQLVTKIRTYESPKLAVNLQPRVVVPTGKRADINDPFDVAGGDGQFDLGMGVSADYFINSKWTAGATMNYIAQLPETVAMRIPESADESLTPDVDPGTRMDLGDIATTSAGVRYKLKDAWTLGGGGAMQYKAKDDYRGGRYAGQRYNHIETDTEQFMGSALASVSYSTIPAFREKRFPVPLEASLTGAQVLTGRNVKKNTVAAFELAMFF